MNEELSFYIDEEVSHPEGYVSFTECLKQLIDYHGYSPEQAKKYLMERLENMLVRQNDLNIITSFYQPNHRCYLQSEKWKEVRQSVKSFFNNCQQCGSFENLQVHHITYERLGREHPDDLILLCGRCHRSKHS